MEVLEACNNVGQQIDAALSNFATTYEEGKRKIEEATEILLSIKRDFEQRKEVNAKESQLGISRVKECLSQLSKQHRKIQKSLSNIEKKIEANFQRGCGVSIFPPILPDSEKLLNQAICLHLLRNGFVESGVEFSRESGLEIDDRIQEACKLTEIQAKLKENHLDAAIAWAQGHHQELLEKNSDLEFKLHQMRFIQILSQGPQWQNEAIAYAKNHFPLFSDRHKTEIAKVMGILPFIKRGVHNSPYGHFFDPVLWTEINELFNRTAAEVLGFSVESPLSTSINVGVMALPVFEKFQKTMAEMKIQWDITSDTEMPIEIDTDGRNYHSVFSCPILKQQSSPSNPPMRLPCGHAMSLDAIKETLARGSFRGSAKCPYCKMVFEKSQVTELHF
ncbi:E3 ubiquitin-protein ligase RMND5A-like isoform X1 [Daphnia pulex]|uniref:E3 ubiquitin-protein ligase RMND5A-like isoform X1 n=1 Tax=Daphnia pulex TaxID=6669 RepID=UPI001EDD3161|nr:E3 ubiquitin-protein ligase RMND5A-like isoform X1 [Daphnia pulex]